MKNLFYLRGREDGRQHAIKYGIGALAQFIGDYIACIDAQHSWDDDERDYIRGLQDILNETVKSA